LQTSNLNSALLQSPLKVAPYIVFACLGPPNGRAVSRVTTNEQDTRMQAKQHVEDEGPSNALSNPDPKTKVSGNELDTAKSLVQAFE
jgi:hypothetical protein